MNAKVLTLALVAAIIALPVPASQLLAGTFSASPSRSAAAPEARDLGLLLQDPFLIDQMSYSVPVRLSDAGLGHALDSGWKQRDDNVFRIGKRMPRKLQEKLKTAPGDLEHFGRDLIDGITELPGDVTDQSTQLWRRTMGVDPMSANPTEAKDLESPETAPSVLPDR